MAQIVVMNGGGWAMGERGEGGRSSNKYTAGIKFNGDGWDEEDCELVGNRVEERGMRVMRMMRRRGAKRRTGPTGEMAAAFPTLFGWPFRPGFQQ